MIGALVVMILIVLLVILIITLAVKRTKGRHSTDTQGKLSMYIQTVITDGFTECKHE